MQKLERHRRPCSHISHLVTKPCQARGETSTELAELRARVENDRRLVETFVDNPSSPMEQSYRELVRSDLREFEALLASVEADHARRTARHAS